MNKDANPYKSPETVPTKAAVDFEDHDDFEDGTFHLNLRKGDNLVQALCMLVSIGVFALIGAVYAVYFDTSGMPWFGGAILGGIVGLVFGFLASGITLRIYRGAGSKIRSKE